MVKIAIIGGTGVYDPDLLDDIREVVQETKYGSVNVTIGNFEGQEVVFIPRHGSNHSVPPHLINYRANIMALKELGVENIIATAAVGSINLDLKPGDFVLADQFLDFTKVRNHTFFAGGDAGVTHCDMTIPYCPRVRKAIEEAGKVESKKIHNGGVYVCTEGPRFETAAEIDMFKILGGDLIGMTSVPEVTLARELGICYGNISIVTNFAAGISSTILTHSEVVEKMQTTIADVRVLIMNAIKHLDNETSCDCAKILDETEMKND
ncbi:MAG TPA: S-methyl-5'-thioadenosine phosphorylase [Syntrophomonadaceae bacterium]|nr:S-methyl-5'-thioadenosine phosphorylase [Syntrophomonadaceae bacterium]